VTLRSALTADKIYAPAHIVRPQRGQTRFGGQPEELLASSVGGPVPRVPCAAAHTAARTQHRLAGGDGVRAGADLPGRQKGVVGRALIAQDRRRHDDVPDGDVRVRHPSATAGDDLPAPQRDDFLPQPVGQHGANAGMKDSQPPALDVALVEAVRPTLVPHMADDRGSVLLAEQRNDVLEEAGYSELGRVDGSTMMSGLDDRFTRAVELQDGIVVVLDLATRR
jgi:hypothetical protein